MTAGGNSVLVRISLLMAVFCHATFGYAQSGAIPQLSGSSQNSKNTPAAAAISPVASQSLGLAEERAKKENEIPPNFFAITFYKPTYVLPYYYTWSPYKSIYENNTPNNEKIKRDEIKYQISFKVPVWKNILHRPITLYLAYSQLSYWQAYNKTAFFRETNYEPELFLANEINFRVLKYWTINFLNLGAVHESNGKGGSLERSWNRLYLEAISSNDHFMFSIKPWLVIHDQSLRKYNPNIADFLGYGQLLAAYKFYHQVISIQAHNLIESGGKHATAELTWSFPITSYLNGYVDIFSGYGQSLIEYNHRTNSAGIGIALSNWV
jgi:phospholipase A1